MYYEEPISNAGKKLDNSIPKTIFYGVVDEIGIVDVLIGTLIGIGIGAASMAIYFAKCKNNEEEK